MTFSAVLHAEWIKIRSVRALGGAILAVFFATVAFSLLGSATIGHEDAGKPGFDPVLTLFFGLNFGQIAAICFGATAVTSEYGSGAIRTSLIAVPRRGLFYAAKLSVIGGLACAVGLMTGLACFLGGQALIGAPGGGIGEPGGLRAAVGCALYLTLITLFAAGLAAVLRSGPAVMGILIPFLLLVSFVIGDVNHGAGLADFLPDRAGQQVLLQHSTGSLGPWSGLAVTAGWAAAAVGAGWAALCRRDV
ncbi:ABC transporter permease [Streptomyces sp. NBC_01020]|uniref:ABC transporter permease n=1 Tax=unclassified Streptomyces TaxID=2593676 RepID=UPI002E2330FA|nr:ABC transporter permease [Streptomyces sp. NBC_01020]WSX71204.1 ABC transporter permease [Streptomyces sp. NBC_00932]